MPAPTIRQLRDIRNDMAHDHDKKLTTEDYVKLHAQLSKIITDIGGDPSTFPTRSNDAAYAAESYREQATQLITTDPLMALELYQKAIILPSLPDVNLAVLYSDRCDVYLQLFSQVSKYYKLLKLVEPCDI
jgi:hypothetical protein